MDILQEYFGKCVVKEKTLERSSSLAFTSSDRYYGGAFIEADTNLLAICSEQVALARSTAANDFPARRIVTLYRGDGMFSLSPLIVKILIDYRIRTQQPFSYSVIDEQEKVLFEVMDIIDIFPAYRPAPIILQRTARVFSPNVKKINLAEEEIAQSLRQYAIEGLERNFPLYDTASGYGAAVYTKGGVMYWSGQYSSPDKRLGVHAEMNAVLCALMDGATNITHLGVVSTKHKDAPCNMCGMCRQFFAEMSVRFTFNATIHCFARETNEEKTYTIEEYLPSVWTSRV